MANAPAAGDGAATNKERRRRASLPRPLRKSIRLLAVVAIAALLVVLVPIWWLVGIVGVYALLGIVDVSRNERGGEAPVLKRYFAGNGLLTWLLSPFNLAIDMLCRKMPGVMTRADLPDDCRAEIDAVIAAAQAQREQIVARMAADRAAGKRFMLVYKWYGEQVDASVSEFNRDFRYVKTIAVSAFTPDTATKFHYGPLRLTYRMLYNLTPVDRDDVFIEVGRRRHLWRDDPLFIFDDTLMHRSVNFSDEVRYCMFVDIMRPSRFMALNTAILGVVERLLGSVNRIFYKNWQFVR